MLVEQVVGLVTVAEGAGFRDEDFESFAFAGAVEEDVVDEGGLSDQENALQQK